MGKQDMRIQKPLFALHHFRRNTVLTVVLLALGFSSYYVVSPPSVQGISSTIVISQVYGGGGNAGATYRNDFLELFNRGNVTVDVTGWSVQYMSAAGTGTWQVTALCSPGPCNIAPGQYFLVQEAQGAGGTTNLPTPDAIGAIAMSATSAKVALVNDATALTGNCPASANIVDLVGYGSSATCSEGAATATLTNTTAALRAMSGCTDTDNNSTDFSTGAPNPRNTATPLTSCSSGSTPPSGTGAANPNPVAPGGSTLLTVTVTPGTNPPSTGITVTGDLSLIGGSASQQFFDDMTHGDVTPGDNVFSFQATVSPSTLVGSKTMPIAIADAQSRAAATSINLSVQSGNCSACGVERWSVKTGTDPDASSVNLNPVQTTIVDMRSWAAPDPIPPNNRFAPHEFQTYFVDGTLTLYKLEDDSDYHVVLQDGSGNTFISEFACPACIGAGSPFASEASNARAEFDARYTPTTSFQTANIPVRVTGVAMFDFLHGQTGVAPNGIELHPLLDVIFNPTAVRFVDQHAYGQGNDVLIQWQTGYEVDNLGFNVYRELNGRRARVTPQLVAGSALMAGPKTGLTAGQTYSWWDSTTNRDARYWIEDIDLNGRSVWHGPIAIDQSSPFPRHFVPGSGRARILVAARKVLSAHPSTVPVERTATSHQITQASVATQSKLASSSALKLLVKKEGLYRITQPELVAAGLDAKVNPRNLQLFTDGQEQPFIVTGERDGRFDKTDAIEFYGIGLDTPSTDTRAYWLVAGTRPGKRIELVEGRGSSAKTRNFPYTVERKDRTVYFSGLRNGEKENFFGAVIARDPVDQILTIGNLDKVTTGEATLEVALQGVTTLQHRVTVEINETAVGEVSFDAQTEGLARLPVPYSSLKEGENLVTLTPQNGDKDVSLVDSIRITYAHTFTAENNALEFTASGKSKMVVDGFTNSAIRIVDVTNADAVRELSVIVEQRGETYAATVAAPKGGHGQYTLLAFTDDQMKHPIAVTPNQSSDLRSKEQEADLLVITRRDFFSSLEPLKALRQSQGLKVAVVDVEDVFDEFSFGEKSPQAIRDFLSYAQANWRISPGNVLLVGDASLDPKNYLGVGDFDLVPTKLLDTRFMETASDDWFSDFAGDGLPALAIGRLPVRTPQEAESMIAKIVEYEGMKPIDEVLLVSDSNDGYDFATGNAALKNLIPPRRKG
jgi:hypothetical protein